MPVCPQCGDEYIDGTTRCDDCGVELVDSLPDARRQGSRDDLAEVWHVQGEMEAQMIRSLLDANNIDSMIEGESLRLTHGFTIDGLAEVRILVREGDAKKACEVIATLEGMRQCPNCGHPARTDDAACHYCKTVLD